MGSVATATPPTAVTPTPVQRPPEKAVQRTAHSSAIGHGLGFGGNGALWAFGTYGWGWAAAIGGATVVGMGAKHLRNRRRGGRGGGLFGGGRGGRIGGSRGGLLGRLGGRGRSGGGLGLGGGRGRPGGLGSRAGRTGSGFLGKLAGKRSSTPKGGGGLPSRGTGKGGLLGRRKSGSGLPGSGRGGRGLGSRPPGVGRGRGGGLLGGSRGKSRGGLGVSRGSGRGATGGGSRGRGKSLLGSLNPFGGRNRGANTKGRKFGRGIKNGAKRLLNLIKPGNKTPDPKNKQQRQSTWEEVPLQPKNNTGTEWKGRTMSPARRRVSSPSGGSSAAGGGGTITAAAEQFAATLAKPPTEVNTLKTFDQDLGDLAGAVAALQIGLKTHASVVQAGMPDESATHEELGRYTQQLGQMAEGLKILQADQRRRNASDHERVDNGRRNEKGYDWQANQQ